MTSHEKIDPANQEVRVAHVTTIDMSLRYLLLSQLEYLQEIGYQVTGVSSSGDNVAVLEASGIHHISVSMTRSFTPFADLKSFWRLFQVMRHNNFTVVHTHNPKPGLLGQLAARAAGVPLVVNTLHGYYFHENMPRHWQKFYILTEKIAAKCSDVILSQNKEDLLTAEREGICRKEQIKFLGNGIDIDRFDRDRIDSNVLEEKRRELGLPEDSPVVGFVGRLVAEKGLPELFQAISIVREHFPDARFLLIGPVDDHKADSITPDLAEEYGIADHCVFPGMRQDMEYLYPLMDVFVLPSHREGFPRAPMEASAMSVPTIVTDIRGCRETVEQGRNGFLMPLGDVDALAGAIIELLGDKEMAKEMGEEGRRIAEKRFDERLVFAKVKAEYARLLHEKGLPVPSEQRSQAVSG